MPIAADRSANVSNTTGTGTFSLDRTKLGYQSLISGLGSGSTVYYSAVNNTTGQWEVGYGVLTFGSPSTLTRAVVEDGSNGPGVHVDFAGPELDVFSTAPASRLPLIDPTTGALAIPGAISLATPLAVTSGGTGLSSLVLGDTLYASASNTLHSLAGNTTTTKKFLSQTGTGTASAAPIWAQLTAADIGAGTFSGAFTFSSLTVNGGAAAGPLITLAGGGLGLIGIERTNGAGAGNIRDRFVNAGGVAIIGVESSTGGSLLTGSAAYTAVVGSSVAKPLDFGTNGVRRGGFSATGAFDVTAGASVVSPLSVTGIPTSTYSLNGVTGGTQVFTDEAGSNGISSIVAYGGMAQNAVLKTKPLGFGHGIAGIMGAATNISGGRMAAGVFGYGQYVAGGAVNNADITTGGLFITEMSSAVTAFRSAAYGVYGFADLTAATGIAAGATAIGVGAFATGVAGSDARGLHASASGGTNNWAIWVELGDVGFKNDGVGNIGAPAANRPNNLYVKNSGTFGTALTVGGALTVNATGSVVSAGTDASTTLSIGSGGGTPTNARQVNLFLNAPSSGGAVGSVNQYFQRNNGTVWGLGINSTTSGAVTSITDLGFFNGSAYVAALTNAGLLRLSGGIDIQGGGISVNAGGINVNVGGVAVGGAALLNGTSGVLQLGTIAGAITSTLDAYVAWANSLSPLNPGGVNGSLLLASRNTSGAEVVIATQNTVRGRWSSGGLTVAVGGIGIGATPINNGALYIGATLNTAGQTTQYGIFNDGTFGSNVTSQAIVYYARVRTAATAFTVPTAYGIYVADASKGAGSSITQQIGIYVSALSAGATNYALVTNGRLSFRSLPTSSAGLMSGDVWNNAGIPNIVP